MVWYHFAIYIHQGVAIESVRGSEADFLFGPEESGDDVAMTPVLDEDPFSVCDPEDAALVDPLEGDDLAPVAAVDGAVICGVEAAELDDLCGAFLEACEPETLGPPSPSVGGGELALAAAGPALLDAASGGGGDGLVVHLDGADGSFVQYYEYPRPDGSMVRQLTANCRRGHGNKCRLECSVVAAAGARAKSRLAQGRPLGLLVGWLAMPDAGDDRTTHIHCRRPTKVFREECRRACKDEPRWAVLCSKERPKRCIANGDADDEGSEPGYES